MKRLIPVLLFLSLLCGYAQTKAKVFVGDIEGPDPFINERFKMLFLEELGKVKSVELVDTKEVAQYLLSGIGRVDTQRRAVVLGGIAGAGEVNNALLSIKITNPDGQILFVSNKSGVGGRKGASHNTVIAIVKDMKKQLKWK